jgi:hypothetical protein
MLHNSTEDGGAVHDAQKVFANRVPVEGDIGIDF